MIQDIAKLLFRTHTMG